MTLITCSDLTLATCLYGGPHPLSPYILDTEWWVHRITNILITRHSQHIIRMPS